MGKRKSRFDKIFPTDHRVITKQCGDLRKTIRDAQLHLKPASAHSRALDSLLKEMRTAENVLADRPPDYQPSHVEPGFMSRLPPNASGKPDL